MGGVPSRYNAIEFGDADIGLKPEETAAKKDPSPECTKIKIVPTGGLKGLAFRRDYEVKNSKDEVIYTTEGIDGLGAGFDLKDPEGNVVLRLASTSTRMRWMIYHTDPTYEGQECDQVASEACEQRIYKRARVLIDPEKFNADVSYYKAPEGEDKEHIAYATGALGDPVLLVEKLKSLVAAEKFQSYRPKKGVEVPPLSGNWHWDGVAIPVVGKSHMEVDVAKGADLELHAILPIITEILAVDRRRGNAI